METNPSRSSAESQVLNGVLTSGRSFITEQNRTDFINGLPTSIFDDLSKFSDILKDDARLVRDIIAEMNHNLSKLCESTNESSKDIIDALKQKTEVIGRCLESGVVPPDKIDLFLGEMHKYSEMMMQEKERTVEDELRIIHEQQKAEQAAHKEKRKDILVSLGGITIGSVILYAAKKCIDKVL